MGEQSHLGHRQGGSDTADPIETEKHELESLQWATSPFSSTLPSYHILTRLHRPNDMDRIQKGYGDSNRIDLHFLA